MAATPVATVVQAAAIRVADGTYLMTVLAIGKWVVVAVVVAFVAVLGFFIIIVTPGAFFDTIRGVFISEERNRFLEEALHLAGQGDFNRAQQYARIALETDNTEEAQSALEVGLFFSGVEDQRIEAVRLAKESYLNATDPLIKAIQINKLFGFINAGSERYIFNEVFSGEPFEQFLVKGDRSVSLRNLAKHSLSLYPTTDALYRIAYWHADRIGDIWGTWNTTADEKSTHADEILRLVGEADILLTSQKQILAGEPFDYMIQARHLFWKSYLYGYVARVRPEYLTESKKALDELERYYEISLDENGNRYPLIAARLPSAYVSYARTLYEMQEAEASGEIGTTLDEMIALIDENPGVHEGAFLSTIRRDDIATTTNRRRGSGVYRALAELHPPFKEFLMRYGWTFVE